MFGQPWYRNYPPNVSYNPYLHNSYQRSSPFESPAHYDDDAKERLRALAERRARRAQWLPDEVYDDNEDDYDDINWNYQRRKQQEALQRRQAFEAQKRLEEQQRQEALSRMEEQRRREELRRLEELRQEELHRKIREEEEARQRAEQQRRRSNEKLKRAQLPHPSPPRFIPAGRQEDSSTPIPVHIRHQSPQPKQSPPSPTSKPSDISVEASQPKSRGPSSSRSPSPARSPKLQTTHTIEEQNLAASRIQKQYRIHASFRTLSQYEREFEALKKGFVFPSKIDFHKPGSGEVVTVLAYRPPSEFDKEPEQTEGTPMDIDGAEGKPAYTPTNYALHTYTDALDKLLMKLDGVESCGQKSIRQRRRGIVKNIEKESSKVDRYWRQAWADYLEKQSVKPDLP